MDKKAWLIIAAILVTFASKVAAQSGNEANAEAEPATEVSGEVPVTIETAPRYRTREEQREAGLERELTDWLKVSTLFETELLQSRTVDEEGAREKSIEESISLQLGLELEASEYASLEAVVEYDSNEDRFLTEEVFLTLERDPWEIALGKQFTPFGSYFSRFANGPMLEFGETQADKAVALIYGPSDDLDITLMYYQGQASHRNESDEEWNWSAGLELWLNDGLSLGLSYQADLADSDERLLEELDDRYLDRVDALSGYLFSVMGDYELSLEYLAALSPFKALPGDRDEPQAWNLELSRYFTKSSLEIALRLEGSRELVDMPRQRYGLSMTNYVTRRASFTLEYLRGRFGNRAVFRDEDERLHHEDIFGASLSIEL